MQPDPPSPSHETFAMAHEDLQGTIDFHYYEDLPPATNIPLPTESATTSPCGTPASPASPCEATEIPVPVYVPEIHEAYHDQELEDPVPPALQPEPEGQDDALSFMVQANQANALYRAIITNRATITTTYGEETETTCAAKGTSLCASGMGEAPQVASTCQPRRAMPSQYRQAHQASSTS